MEVNVVNTTMDVMDVAFPASGQSLIKWQGNFMKLPGKTIKDLATTGNDSVSKMVMDVVITHIFALIRACCRYGEGDLFHV